MAVDDRWYRSKRGPGGERVQSQRYGRGKRWRVRYTDDAGRPRERLFDRKPDADRFDANVRADVSRGVYVDPAAGRITVAAYGSEWRATRLHADSTGERVERALRVHVDPILGGLRLAQVRPSHIQAWVKDRATVLQPSTLRVVYSYLVSMFTAAALDRLIGTTPCVNIQLPEVEKRELFIPTAEQVEALGMALPDQFAAMPVVAAGTGLRQGEVWGLEVEHLDFLRRKVRVVQQLKVTDARAQPFLAPPKTALSKRTVELGDVPLEALARHLELFPPVEVEIDDETDPRRPVRRKAKLVFTNQHGRPISRHSWSHTWTPAVARTDLPKGFRFHALRDFFATALIHGGASVKTVQLALGHSTPTITLNTYVGQWPDAVDTTRALIDAAFGRSMPTPAPARLAVVR